MGTDDMEGIYPEQVRLAPQWEFNSYHPITAQDQHDTWHPGKFAIAFNGVLSGVADSQIMMSVIYGNYYVESCERNLVNEQCVEAVEIQPWLQTSETPWHSMLEMPSTLGLGNAGIAR